MHAESRRSGGTVAVAVGVAVVVWLAVLTGAAYGVYRVTQNGGLDRSYAGTLHEAVGLREIVLEQPAPCGAGQLPGLDGKTCYGLGDGFTVREVKALRLGRPAGSVSETVSMTLGPADAVRFGDLTTKAYAAYEENPGDPHSKIAVVAGQRVLIAPQVGAGPITGGQVQISGPAADSQEFVDLYRRLTGR